MASFSAELCVAGQSFPVTSCSFGVEQATHQRGRVSTKVRYGPVQLTLDVPNGDELLAWAAAPHQRQAAKVVFRNGVGGSPLETLRLAAAYCVSYAEAFVQGDVGSGAYVCHLTLSDPDGWTLQAGGPAAAFAAPAAREHGVPSVVEGVRQKLPVIPLADGIGPADWLASQDLPTWTVQHKAARWAEYQRDKLALNEKPKAQAAWDNQYETNRNNNIFGLAREREYVAAMGAKSKVLKTKYTLRQIDMYKKDDAGIYCGQLKTGFVYLTKQAKIDLKKDAWLAATNNEVEYILEKGGSQPLLAAIKAAGATYRIGPQIP